MISDFKGTLRNYNWNYFKKDLEAGLTVTAVGLPQSMAYALIAGVNPVYGIYTSIVSMITATVFGVSSYMVVGPTNIMAVAIASSLGFLQQGSYLQAVLLLTMLTGVIQILLGVLKLGDLVNYISNSVIVGLTSGVALLIIAGQLANLLGIDVGTGYNLFTALYNVGQKLYEINLYSLVIGMATAGLIYLFKKFFTDFPHYILVLGVVILITYVSGLDRQIETVGQLSSTVPAFRPFSINLKVAGRLFSSAFSLAILGFIQVLSIVKALENRSGQIPELNQEFISQGLINIVCSFFQGFAITGSFTRSFANYEAGASTRLAQLFSAITLLIALILLKPIIKYIPVASLAAVVIVVALSMFEPEDIKRGLRTTTFDAIVMTITFIMTVTAPRIDYAVFFGVIVSFILVLKNTSNINYSHISYREESEEDFARENIEEVKDDNCIIINLAGTLHFNSAENLKKNLEESFRENKIFVIRLRDVDDIDATSIRELEKFIDRVQRYGGDVILSGVDRGVYDSLEKFGICDKLPEENIFHSNDRIFSSTKEAINEAEKKQDGD